MPAARRIDEIAAFGQASEEIRGENALGLGRQRQEADEDPRAREETSQPLAAVKAGDPVDRFRRTAPSGDVEAERGERAGGRAAQLSKAHDSDRLLVGLAQDRKSPRLKSSH